MQHTVLTVADVGGPEFDNAFAIVGATGLGIDDLRLRQSTPATESAYRGYRWLDFFVYFAIMGLLDVDPAGLQVLAACCESWAAEVAAAAPPMGAMSSQASAAAVRMIHADAAAAGVELGGRLQSVAAKLSVAAVKYVDTDETSAAGLSALNEGS